MVEDVPGANTMLTSAQRWGLVIDVQDALNGLVEMIEALNEAEAPIPGQVASIIRVIGARLDTPLGIEGS